MSKIKKSRKRISRESALECDKSYTDFLCPICLEILIEPVQMPCEHELCMECFKSHVKDTSLTCPMCRLRISTWLRKSKKCNTLVNMERWELIKKLFPDRVQRRLESGDDFEESFSEYNAAKHIIAPPGEVKREFEEQLKKIKEEEEKAQKEDLDFIKQLQYEESLQRQRQEESDQAAALELQKQEMKNLGVTLKSPTQHQRELLAYLKPKSPMKLRHRKSPESSKCLKNLKAQRQILSTSNQPITTFFKKTNSNRTQEFTPLQDKNNLLEIDAQIAAQFQRKFENQMKTIRPLHSKKHTKHHTSSHTLTMPAVDIENNDDGNLR